MIEKAELTDNAMNQIVEVVKPFLEKKDKEIERLNNDIKVLLKENSNKEKVIKTQENIIKKVLFILEHMKDDRVGYEVCIDLLKGEDKE